VVCGVLVPELPEVESVVRSLAPCIVGRRIRRVQVFDPLLGPAPENFAGQVVTAVERVGKEIAIGARRRGGREETWLIVHLRMTGRLVWGAGVTTRPAPPVRARLLFDDGEVLFSDVRRFGSLRACAARPSLPAGAVDPFVAPLSAEVLRKLASGARQAIKVWLLRQDRICGIGNIYASEILFESGVSPWVSAGAIDGACAERICRATTDVLGRAVQHGGTTISTFRDATGQAGGYAPRLAVYGRAGLPCRTCGRPIERAVQAGRSTFFCPSCQAVDPSLGDEPKRSRRRKK
jgi:formamidopyrimidine-DNA glycosylase